MQTHRFGRKLKLPSSRAIKHEILTLMLQDHLKAQILETTAIEGFNAESWGRTGDIERSLYSPRQ